MRSNPMYSEKLGKTTLDHLGNIVTLRFIVNIHALPIQFVCTPWHTDIHIHAHAHIQIHTYGKCSRKAREKPLYTCKTPSRSTTKIQTVVRFRLLKISCDKKWCFHPLSLSFFFSCSLSFSLGIFRICFP